MDVVKYNSIAWDRAVEEDDTWTRPVSAELIASARNGDWEIVLTPEKPVPRSWFGEVAGKDILCLASGGGQQAPILAAAGARVTSFDNSERQLLQDKTVADREGLEIRLEIGDAADLSRFDDDSFELIFHPCSNLFMPDIWAVWRECFRVLRPGGELLSGITKPEVFIFDRALEENEGVLRVRHALPYADEVSLTDEELVELREKGEPLEFSHTLEAQLGGQIEAGFHLTGFYEDYWEGPTRVLNKYMPTFIATRALKPQ